MKVYAVAFNVVDETNPVLFMVAAKNKNEALGYAFSTCSANISDIVGYAIEVHCGEGTNYGVSAEVGAFILKGMKINAIKQYRNETGSGLKESKRVVDRVHDLMVKDGLIKMEE